MSRWIEKEVRVEVKIDFDDIKDKFLKEQK